ncbi:hypothetical protein HDU92_000155 [Lobulomyces angularis]|nr:hypothetical protein HDU92_000155 [Lobulomyces angularis]
MNNEIMIKRLYRNEELKVYLDNNAKLPTKGSKFSAGYDIYCSSNDDIIIKAQNKNLIPTGIKIELPENTYGRIAPRSGLAFKFSLNVGAEKLEPVFLTQVDKVSETIRGEQGFGSTGKKNYDVNIDLKRTWEDISNWKSIHLSILNARCINHREFDTSIKKDYGFQNAFSEVYDSPYYIQVNKICYDLLNYCKFEDKDMYFIVNAIFYVEWLGYKMFSRSSFGVYDRYLSTNFFKCSFIIKTIPNESDDISKQECELFGEILLAAINNYNHIKRSQHMFGMIIQDMNVRFYSYVFGINYLSSFANNNRQTYKAIIKRYPSIVKDTLSLLSSDNRKEIIEILDTIKILIKI